MPDSVRRVSYHRCLLNWWVGVLPLSIAACGDAGSPSEGPTAGRSAGAGGPASSAEGGHHAGAGNAAGGVRDSTASGPNAMAGQAPALAGGGASGVASNGGAGTSAHEDTRGSGGHGPVESSGGNASSVGTGTTLAQGGLTFGGSSALGTGLIHSQAGQAGASAAGAGGEGTGLPSCVDLDKDGYGSGSGCLGADCDDLNPLVNPAMVELADDGRDNDCAGGDLHASAGVGYYVDQADANCSDVAVPHGTQSVPYCSLLAAVVQAYQNTPSGEPVGRTIFVAKGTYPSSIGFPRSMRLYGGYDSTDWSYDPEVNETVIGGVDDLGIYTSWLTPTVDCNAVIQGFSIKGGKRSGSPIFAAEIYSSGRVVLAYNTIVAGTGNQTVGINVKPEANDVLLLGNRISAGVAESSSNYGLNNLGTATLIGNVIDAGQGHTGSWAAAVQNYGTMYLAGNLLNCGDYGGAADDSYGFINLQTGSPPSAGTAYAVGNVIYAGHGTANSTGVLSNSPLTLIDNVIGDRTPAPLPWSERPTSTAAVLDVGFASSTVLQHNALVQLVYSDENAPPDPAAPRHLLTHSSTSTAHVEDIALVNACAWTGCQSAAGNLAVEPEFVGAEDYHLSDQSLLLGAGTDPGTSIPGGLGNIDLDGDLRPLGSAWEIGIDELSE